MSISPGTYKIRYHDLLQRCAIMEVFKEDGELFYSVNDGARVGMGFFSESGASIVSQIKTLDLKTARIIIEATDSQSDNYEWRFRNIHDVKIFFEKNPEIRKALL